MPTTKSARQRGGPDFVDFAEVKKSVSIVQILEHYELSLQQSGDHLTGPCPIHKGHNKTQFRVSISKNCWNCFGKCKGGGNILDFVSKMEDMNIREAALLIQKWFLSDKTPEKPAKRPVVGKSAKPESDPEKDSAPDEQACLPDRQGSEEVTENKPLSFSLNHLDPDHAYLEGRGLDPDTIKTFGLGFCSKGILAGRVAIPIHNGRGEIVAYAGRRVWEPDPDDTPKYKLPAGFRKSLEVFNLHRARLLAPEHGLIVVEGYFDCMKLWQAGILNVVAIMGSTLSEAQEKLLVDAVGPQGKLILLFDEDDAGRAGRDQALLRLGRQVLVKAIPLGSEGLQPEQLSGEELRQLGL